MGNLETSMSTIGRIDGSRFFSQSPFRSAYFLAVTLVFLACTTYDLFLVLRYWHRLTTPALLTLWMVGCGVGGAWMRALRYHRRIRCLLGDEISIEAKPGSALHVALSVAAAGMNDALFFCLTPILLLLVYVERLLSVG